MNPHYAYTEQVNPVTHNVMWQIQDIALPLGGIAELMDKFIQEHPCPECSQLIVYNHLSSEAIRITCTIQEIPSIAEYLYHLEKATPLCFVGLDSQQKGYFIEMPLYRGRIGEGTYKADGGKIVPVA